MSNPESSPPQPQLPTESAPRIHRYGVDSLSERSKDQQQRFAHDIEWKVLGPMPTEMFLDEFFPESPDSEIGFKEAGIDSNKINFASVPDSPNREEEMYESLCDNLNEIAEACGFIFCDTSRRPGGSGVLGTVKPDIGLYHIRDENRGHIMDFRKYGKDHGDKAYYTGHMGLVYLFVEIKKEANQDIFVDPPEGLPPPDYRFTVDTWSQNENLGDRISALGQNAHYAHMVQTRQFRTCVFSLTISGRTARIMRWERSGVLVTEAFDYKDKPQILIDLVWRFLKASPARQGFDLTATAVDSKGDRDLFMTAIRSHVQLQLGLTPKTDEEEFDHKVDKHYYHGVITRLTIGDHTIWVSRPLWVSQAIVGRCTAGYWGVRCDTKEVVFVKDVWRTNVEKVELEGDVLNDLRKEEVRHVPTVLCHGDLTNGDTPQTTRTDKFADKPWVKSLHPQDPDLRKIVPRVHYRLVTNTAGYPLSTFKGSRELLGGTFGGFTALMDAHEKAGVLHRDVSLGNIILYRLKEETERVGYLIDWELSCKPSNMVVRDHVLTGTPAFMSIDVLNRHRHVHSLRDDLESFIYVILYAALRWLPVKSRFELSWWMTHFFGAPGPDGLGGGADAKSANAVYRKYTGDLANTKSLHVVDWLRAAMDLHYDGKSPNPLWDDGKALRAMWEGILVKDLPSDDRRVNQIPNMKIDEDHSLHATYTLAASSQDLHRSRIQLPASAPAKRAPTDSLDDSASHTTPEPSKRRRTEELL